VTEADDETDAERIGAGSVGCLVLLVVTFVVFILYLTLSVVMHT
jgi:hypothetical protein